MAPIRSGQHDRLSAPAAKAPVHRYYCLDFGRFGELQNPDPSYIGAFLRILGSSRMDHPIHDHPGSKGSVKHERLQRLGSLLTAKSSSLGASIPYLLACLRQLAKKRVHKTPALQTQGAQ